MPDPTAFERALQIFEEALDKTTASRHETVDRLCGQDDALKTLVRRMLAAHDGNSTFLEADARAAFLRDHATPDLSDRDSDSPPRTVGKYRILERIGSGGMAVVYRAERTDVGGTVALKMIKGELANPSARDRFLQEQRVLARLHHPNIARLLDAGVDAQGNAFITMEYVDGTDIVGYCDRLKLDVSSRLALLLQVGRAVQHAHENFVVHRDIKPSNIFVDAAGSIKLLDFGIAKLVGDQMEDLTQTGLRIATPGYAAPEQIEGGAITAATDVYGLGVVTYELLSGFRPQADRTKEIVKPSTRITNAIRSEAALTDVLARRKTTEERLIRRLRGDLDTICLKALQSDPGRRYPTADAFVEDIKRHLSGLPVTARPDSTTYRARKFIGRHRFGMAVIGLILCGIATLLIQSYRYNTILQQERDRARSEATAARRTAEFMVDVFESADPLTSSRRDLSVGDVLRNGERSIENILAEEPEMSVRMQSLLMNVHRHLGNQEDMLRLAESAKNIVRTHGIEDAEVLGRFEQSVGAMMATFNERDSALTHYESALRLARTSGSTELEADILHSQASTQSALGHYDVADSLYRASTELYRKVPGNEYNVATADASRALTLSLQRRYVEADSLARSALEYQRRVFGDRHVRLTRPLEVLASAQMQTGDYVGADSTLRWELAIWQTIFGSEPHVLRVRALVQYGRLLGLRGDPAAGADTLRKALSVAVASVGEQHLNTAQTHNFLALQLINSGDKDGAIYHLEKALELFRGLVAEDHPQITIVLYNLAEQQSRSGNVADAIRGFREVVERDSVRFGDDHVEVAIDRVKLGRDLITAGRLNEAEPALVHAREVLVAAMPHTIRRVAEAEEQLSRLYQSKGRCDDATRHSDAAIELFTQVTGEDSPDVDRLRRSRSPC